ncbi:MAG: 1-deoxy-D-xylulose-5-phosphate synthase N-terminal domain-containing protein, partial [Gammaproteobacteria bacterium]
MSEEKYPLLYSIDNPRQLKLLQQDQLPQLADELRQYLIEVTSKTGGHLAPGLGTIELTIALHYLLDT